MPKLIGSNVPATSARRARSRRLLWLALGVMGVWAILPTLVGHRVVVINTSPSVAPGLYLRSASEPTVGRIIDFPIPDSARPYVQGRTGNNGENWYILKPIAAGPGDRVDTTGEWLVINGHKLAPMPPSTDSSGRPLPRWRNRRMLGPDEFFVFSDRIPNSFDSRCYGPIRREQISAVRRALIIW
jgi:conjugative transfer signal peptidase TraF